MHDIVRDVAISIAFDKYFVRAGVNLEEWLNMETLGSYNGISLMCNRIFPGEPYSIESDVSPAPVPAPSVDKVAGGR
ncbi:hypothetical protein F0562_017267 [Nyssa sinensis]|uniref:Uncharacterized protein n=1 Tax=Nyssa sinensis TaxID=561372 RepID=A0A5J4ZEH4_9ASTE|nr:hypothetical protein F0562_017267 [Nyssa sinensis]